MSIFPYIYYMIEDFHVTKDASKIAFYAGMVTSSFALAEFMTGFLWGRLSDKIGRKPVLLIGLAGTALSVLVFGFAPNLTVALIARSLGGLLNGNICVLQTTVAELVTVKEQQPRAYTIMPMVWCIGSIVGPMLGGALARPCISYPEIFATGTIWDRFPYLLPNLFSAATAFFGVTVGLLFLEETHALKKHQRDRAREVGDRILALFQGLSWCQGCGKRSPEKKPLLANDSLSGYQSAATCGPISRQFVTDEDLPAYESHENSPRLLPKDSVPTPPPAPLDPSPRTGEPPRIFTKAVVMNIMSYGILAFHTMTYDQLLPVFLSTAPPKDRIVELPFRFVDGFGLETKTIGFIISVQGVYSLLSNYLIVPAVTRRLGSLRLFRLLAFCYFPLYFITPYLVLLPKNIAMPVIYIMVIWKCTFSTMAYPNNAILLANSAPSREVLGTINGVAASTASLCRALGPMLSGLLYSFGMETGYSGLAWWFTGLTTIVGAYLSTQIVDPRQQGNGPEERDAQADPLLDESLLAAYDEDESV